MINRTTHRITFIFFDFLAAFLAWLLFYTVRKHILGEESAGLSARVLLQAAAVASFWILLYALLGAYRPIYRQSRVKEIFTLAQVSLLGAIIIFFGLLLDDQGGQHYRAYYKTLAAYFGIHFFFAALSKTAYITGTPLIQIKQDLMPVWQEVAKRGTDMLFSLLGLILCLPLFLVLALLVKLSSPGPVLYRQQRIGRGGQPFTIFKFRSMYAGAEKNGPALSCDQDPRVTPWGRIMRRVHLDELPQFYNVLLGQMSLVGPRPERQHFIDLIQEKAPHYKHLLRVRPGITSLGLVKFGYAQNVTEMTRRLRYDIIYIENMSLAMDLRVMLYTIKVIIEGRGT